MSNNYEQINELIFDFKNGNYAAIFHLYQFYEPLLLASVKRCLLKDKNLIPYKEDIIEDCFLVFEKLVNQYDSTLTYFSYFLSTRIDINLFRYVTDKYKPLTFLEDTPVTPDTYYDPFNKIDDVIVLHSAIEKLNKNQREAVELYFFDNMDQEEAAKHLNITQSSFSKRLQRALVKLKEILGEDFLL